MFGRRSADPTLPPAPPRRPDPDQQCAQIAQSTGRRCARWSLRGAQHCRAHAPTAPAPAPSAALSAAVATFQLDGVGWQTWRPGSRAWQNEGWRLYDITGQLRFVANWVGNSISRCRLYVAEVDEAGEAGQESQDPDIANLASGPLGVGPAKDEALRLLGINLFVPGEAYIVAEAEAGPDGEDQWFVVSARQIRRVGDQVAIRRDLLHGGGDMIYRPGVDLILRVWTPHPSDTDEPDSPTRSAIPDLREIEAIRKREFAELDSRLAGAGILPLPDGIDFPAGDDDEPAGIEGFIRRLANTMSRSLTDRSSAEAMVPIMFTVPGEYLDKIKPVTFWSDLSAQLLPLREAAVVSLAQSLDVPPEILLGQGDSNHWCTVRDVEIMTRTGWKTYDELAIGEPVLTLNHDTGLSEWAPVLDIKTWDVTDLPMVAINGRGHSSLTTMEHRWPILSGGRWKKTRDRTFTTSRDLLEAARDAGPDTQTHDYLVLAALNADLPTEAKYSDALVELVAWYFTEGTHGVRAGRHTPKVAIYQSHQINPDNCARIARALTVLFGPESAALDKGGRYASADSVARRGEARRLRAQNPRMSATEIGRRLGVSGTMAGNYLRHDARERDSLPRWRITTSPATGMTRFLLNAAAAEILLEHAPGRVVRLDFIEELTASQLALFIDTAARGDGYRRSDNSITFGQKDPRMCDAVELAAILSGRYVNRYETTGTGRSATGPRTKIQHTVSIGTRTTFAPRGRSFTEQTYTGTIWCPVTPNRTWLARHEGTVFYTGNSAWQVSEDAITTQIVPLLARIADALTTGYLRTALEGMGLDPGSHVYQFDPSPLTVRPNRSADALSYHAVGLISDAAAVDAGAFREDEMPSRAERLRRLVEQAVASNPGLLLTDPAIRAMVGLTSPPPPPPAVGPGPSSPSSPPPAPQPPPEPRALPQPTPQTEQPDGARLHPLIPAAGLAVRRALALAGGRLVPHQHRDRYPGTPRYQLHTRVGPVTPAKADMVLRGAWDDLVALAADLDLDGQQLQALLHGFTCELLTRGMAYDPGLLADLIEAAMRGRRLHQLAGVS